MLIVELSSTTYRYRQWWNIAFMWRCCEYVSNTYLIHLQFVNDTNKYFVSRCSYYTKQIENCLVGCWDMNKQKSWSVLHKILRKHVVNRYFRNLITFCAVYVRYQTVHTRHMIYQKNRIEILYSTRCSRNHEYFF